MRNIKINVLVEGIQEGAGVWCEVADNATIYEALMQIVQTRQQGYEYIQKVFFDTDFQPKIYLVLVNGELVRFDQFSTRRLREADKVFLVNIFAGG